ncbi:MAG: LacI family DNA-binding transcriptional regulator [Chloroflexota bacterium]
MKRQSSDRRATLRDVAAHAGLSVSAVSQALLGRPGIPDATRSRVREAVAALGYAPNSAARALRTRSSTTVGLLLLGRNTARSLAIHSEAVLAVADEVLRGGYDLKMVHGPTELLAREPLEKTVARADLAGAVCIGIDARAADLRALVRRDFPFIFVGKRELPGVPIPFVSTDYLGGARMAAEHLLRLGHCRIAVAFDPGVRDLPWIRDRIAGYTLALHERQPVAEGPLELHIDDTGRGAEPEDVDRWRATGISAIFAVGYPTASIVLRALHLRGVGVPGEMAVVGFDDLPEAAAQLPPLTTVKQPEAALGALAARTLLAWLGGAPREAGSLYVPATLVVRRSCGGMVPAGVDLEGVDLDAARADSKGLDGAADRVAAGEQR